MEKIRFPENKPPGNWALWEIGSGWFEVAGVAHRYDDVLSFLRLTSMAIKNNRTFGIVLRPEPTNAHDRDAVQVHGILGEHSAPAQSFFLGYIPRAITHQVKEIREANEIAAELKQVTIGEEKIWVSVAGLRSKTVNLNRSDIQS